MAETTIHGWQLPDGTDRPVVHTDMKTLADQMDGEVPYVCTSTTRPAHVTGLLIYETDTKRTRQSTGTRWMVRHQPWKSYTPELQGAWNLGSSGTENVGAYCIFGDEMVQVHMKVKWGVGAGNPQTFPYVALGLPFAIAGGPASVPGTEGFGSFVAAGHGTHLYDGFGGGQKNLWVAGGVAGTGVQVFSWPVGGDFMNSMVGAGYGFKDGTVICVNYTYRAVIPD